MRKKNRKQITKKIEKQIKHKITLFILAILTILISIVVGYLDNTQKPEDNNQEQNQQISSAQTNNTSSEENLKIYFIDVGQADSILITHKNEAMLIDAGKNESGNKVVNFIKEKGITKLKYLVGTHPHEDHIGGLDNVINSFAIGNVYMPKITTNTKTYESVVDALLEKNLTITVPKKGDIFTLGNTNLEIMTDSILKKENLNVSSIMIRLTYQSNSFLFTGDAETENEKTREWPKTDVLKVGHHGSTTSSSSDFLKQIKPTYAIITVGKDNDYGHPKDTILKRLESIGSKIYRTDQEGNIELTSDGENIAVTTNK